MPKNLRIQKTSLLLGVWASSSLAIAAELRGYSESCEVALALSAAPKHLWAEAGVYVLRDRGYEQVRAASNGFDCIVERNHRDSVIPQCFDSQSAGANLAVILEEGELLVGESSFESLSERRSNKLAAGDYPQPGPGVAYMISDYNFIYNYQQGAMLKAAPHVMFHAPNLSSRAIGASSTAAFSNRGLPILNAEGPHGFMVSFVERASDSSEVEKACAGQLPSERGTVPFPPTP